MSTSNARDERRQALRMVATSDLGRFEALYEAEAIALVGYAARRLERPTDAADVVAEVFTVAWRRIGEVPAGGDARPWLFGVARNVIANQRRGGRRQDRLADRLRAELAALPALTLPASEDVLLIRDALDQLADDDRELLQLTNWEGLSPSDVARAMGIPAGTVRSRLHRARQQLRRVLEESVDAAPWGNGRARSGQVGTSDLQVAADTEDLP